MTWKILILALSIEVIHFDAAFSSSPPFENVVEVTVLLVFND